MVICMAKTKIETKIHQIDPYEPLKGMDVLEIDEKDSTHYDAFTDRQIRVPIGDVDEYLRKLKGDV